MTRFFFAGLLKFAASQSSRLFWL